MPQEYTAALTSLAGHRARPEVAITQSTAPTRLAPHAVAFMGDVVGEPGGPALANGRFIVLYDPAGQPAWRGRFRVVTLARATVESDLAFDELLAEVAWTWLDDALDGAGARTTARGGTVTRVLSQSFGALADRPDEDEIEVRASWTPLDTELGRHLAAWADLLCSIAGLPPLPGGVTPLRAGRNTVVP